MASQIWTRPLGRNLLLDARLSCIGRCISTPAKPPSVAALVKKLRQEIEGAPIGLAKKALECNEMDYAKAMKWLSEKMESEVSTKIQSQITREGVVAIYNVPSGVAMIELNCQSDFLSRSAPFLQLATTIAFSTHSLNVGSSSRKKGVIDHLDPRKLEESPVLIEHEDDSKLDSPELTESREMIALITSFINRARENVKLRRAAVAYLEDPKATISEEFRFIAGTYTHGTVEERSKGRGRIGSIAVLRIKPSQQESLSDYRELATRIAQTIVGCNIKTLQELMSCPFTYRSRFVASPTTTVGQVLQAAQADLQDFHRYVVGEEIDEVN